MNKSARILLVLLSFTVFGTSFSCGSKQKSDRDVRREQIRTNAEAKRIELSTIGGKYFGLLKRANSEGQNITLSFEIKDRPSSEEGEIDAIMIPTLTGYMRFNYSQSDDDNNDEYISFGLDEAEYDGKTEKLDIVASNNVYGNVLLNLERSNMILSGSWTAPDISESGTIEVIKATESGGTANLTDHPTNGLRGEYGGTLVWGQKSLFQYAKLNLNSVFLPPDGIALSASARLYFGDWDSSEFLSYTFDQVEFNPINGQISIKDSVSPIYFSGNLIGGEFSGQWHSNFTGKLGETSFQKNHIPKPRENLGVFKPLRGTYFGEFESTNSQAQFPKRVLISFVTGESLSQPGGLSISGNVRFYAGSFGSLEYFELPFTSIELNQFTRKIVAKTSGEYNLTIKGDVGLEQIAGELLYDAFGVVGTIELKRGTPTPGGEDIQGDYPGLLFWDSKSAVQFANVTLVTSYNGTSGLNISSTVKLIFGDWQSPEYLTYKFSNVTYNPTNSKIIMNDDDIDVSFVGTLIDGKIIGDWYSSYTGKIGGVRFEKGTDPSIPGDSTLFKALKGTYRGSLENTNPDSNLPPRFFVSFVTSRDLSQPNGINISGSIRFYLGSFDSLEYQELDLSEIRFNFFTRELIAETSGEDNFTLRVQVGPEAIVGNLSHDGLGEVADLELERQ